MSITALAPEISEKRVQILLVAAAHGARNVRVFGSVARGDSGAESDVDLLVEFEPDARVGLLALGRLQGALEALVGRRVDLVPRRGLRPAIREHVLRQARLLYAA